MRTVHPNGKYNQKEDSVMVDPASVGIKIGVDLFTKVAPTGIAWIKTQFFGVSLLTLGERRAGKSSFVNYFEYGILIPPGKKTPRTLETRDTPSFEVAIGREKSLRLQVKRVTDTRGHDSIKEQINLVARRKPAVLMIFLDASRDWSKNEDDYGISYLSSLL